MAPASEGCTAALGKLLGGRVIEGLYRECREGSAGAVAWCTKEVAALIRANESAAESSDVKKVIRWIVTQMEKARHPPEGSSDTRIPIEANDVVSTVVGTAGKTKTTIGLRRSDLLTLIPTEWLNSNVIDAFGTLVKQKCGDPTVDWRHCYLDRSHMGGGKENFLRLLGLYGNAANKARESPAAPLPATRLVTPVNNGNTHWTVVCVDRTDPDSRSGSAAYTITLYDSMDGNDEQVLGTLRRWIQEAHAPLERNRAPTIEARQGACTKQANWYDCGVFSCRFAMHLLCREPVPVPKRDFKGDGGCSDEKFRSLIASMIFAHRTGADAAPHASYASYASYGRYRSRIRGRKPRTPSCYTSETGAETETEETGTETEETGTETEETEETGTETGTGSRPKEPKAKRREPRESKESKEPKEPKRKMVKASAETPPWIFIFYKLRKRPDRPDRHYRPSRREPDPYYWDYAMPTGWYQTGRGGTGSALYPQEESFEGPRATIREAERAIAARLEAKLEEGILVRYAMDRTYTVPRRL